MEKIKKIIKLICNPLIALSGGNFDDVKIYETENPKKLEFDLKSKSDSVQEVRLSIRGEDAYFKLSENVEMKDWTWSSPQTGETNAKTFYLHETTSTDGFEIELKTSDDDADPRTASIPLSIPRNFIQPLVIHITDYSLDITIKTQVAPIGVYPAEVTQNGYEIKLPEGCTFDVTVTAKKNMTPSTWESGASWSWSVTENTFTNTELVFNNDAPSNTGTELTNTNNSFTFSGTVTSMPLTTKSCTITVVLRDGEAEQTFPIVITVRELGDTEWTRSASSEAQPIIIEL